MEFLEEVNNMGINLTLLSELRDGIAENPLGFDVCATYRDLLDPFSKSGAHSLEVLAMKLRPIEARELFTKYHHPNYVDIPDYYAIAARILDYPYNAKFLFNPHYWPDKFKYRFIRFYDLAAWEESAAVACEYLDAIIKKHRVS